MDKKITDIGIYTQQMEKSLIDKIYFLDKIDSDILVDFGCADGKLLQFISNFMPEKVLYGYDLSNDMISQAKKNCPNGNFFTSWTKLEEKLKKEKGKKAIILSSVIHEVYSYSSSLQIKKFWEKVFKFDTIVIRELMVEESANRAIDNQLKWKITKNGEKIADFARKWGNIHSFRDILHYLMKSQYMENWEREVRENYFPISVEELMELIPNQYSIVWFNHYILPYFQNYVKKKFDISVTDKTHLQLILEKE